MSISAVKWAFRQEGLTIAQKLVLVRLAESADADGACFPKRKVIAQDCGVAPESVTRAIREFEKRGLLTVEKQWKRNRYVFNFDASQVTTDHPRDGLSGDDRSLDNVSQVTTDHLEGDDRSPYQVTTDHLTREPSNKPSNFDDEEEGARAIAGKFVELFETHWPERAPLLTPRMTLETEARQFLDAGGTVQLAIQHLEAHMPRVAQRGRSPPRSLKFFRDSLSDELAKAREVITFPSRSNGATRQKTETAEERRKRIIEMARNGN